LAFSSDLLDFLTGATEDSAAGNIHHKEGEGPAAKRARVGGAAGDNSSGAKGGGGGSSSAGKNDGNGGSGRSRSAAAAAASGGRAGPGAQTSFEEAGRDRNGLLSTPGQDFSFALRFYAEAHSAMKKEAQAAAALTAAAGAGSGGSSSGGGASSGGAGLSAGAASASKKKGRDDRLPIIVVPAASNSLITLLNVQQLLEGTRAGQEGGWMGDGRDQPAHARRCGRSLVLCSFV
jgi:hypothetical protein